MQNCLIIVHIEANNGLAIFNRHQLDDDLSHHRLREGCALQNSRISEFVCKFLGTLC